MSNDEPSPTRVYARPAVGASREELLAWSRQFLATVLATADPDDLDVAEQPAT